MSYDEYTARRRPGLWPQFRARPNIQYGTVRVSWPRQLVCCLGKVASSNAKIVNARHSERSVQFSFCTEATACS